ncbi:ribokinase [Ruficoccus amylovorans]|uniref:Ribokinase n=1 Tax=Ruficoccus amylovorans TaxID=1804625 RepID=A0A842HJ66_9BACT|nr:ribokinase [Ruficoccus amylovorans]MBC2596018.1 ribokinase [Ruficoccus amylovorans]
MNTHPAIVVYGSINIDMIVEAAHLPRPGETVLGNDFRMSCGGKGANQAVAAAKAGADVAFIGRIGQDGFGGRALESLSKVGIDTSRIGIDPTSHTGVALISVAPSGENQITVSSGANAFLSKTDIRRSAPALAQARIALAQLEIPLSAVCEAAMLAAENGIPFILNPAPAFALPRDLLELTSFITPNESECEILTGIRPDSKSALGKAAEQLMAQGVKGVLITLGKRGTYFATAERHLLIEAFPVQARDTTGAGDTFNGAFAVALADGLAPEEAIRFANAAAALSVTRTGTHDAAPLRSEIQSHLAKASPQTA